MPLTAQAVADLVGGRLLGNGTVRVTGIAPLDRATPDDLTFWVAAGGGGKYHDAFRHSRAGVVLVGVGGEDEPEGPVTRVVVSNAHQALATVAAAMYPEPPHKPGVHPSAVLGPGGAFGVEVRIGPGVTLGARVRLGDRVRVGPGAVLEDDVEVGEDAIVGPRVVLGAGTRLGRRVTVKAGAVIGGTGFGYVSTAAGHTRIRHTGVVRVGDDVDIGSNTCIDRGSVGDTEIGAGSKIDNLVHLAHNVRLGAGCLVMAGVGVAGSTHIGDGVILAGHVGVVGHVALGDGVRIGAGSKVYSSVEAGVAFTGFPARPHREFLRAQAALYRLAPIVSDLEALVKRAQDG